MLKPCGQCVPATSLRPCSISSRSSFISPGMVVARKVAGLVQAFKAVGRGVQCVIVNACRTERLAQALAAIGPCVIGVRQPVGDQSAIRFSIGFYQALAAGKPVETAFDVGVAQLMMTSRGDDALAPLLFRGLGGAC